jgi:hypothetical protein
LKEVSFTGIFSPKIVDLTILGDDDYDDDDDDDDYDDVDIVKVPILDESNPDRGSSLSVEP